VSHLDDAGPAASNVLLAAALSGLLCVASACSDPGSGSTGDTTSAAGGSGGGGSGSTSSTDATGGSAPSIGCVGGVSPDPQVTTSSVVSLTAEEFAMLCDAKNGVVEIHPHCGGVNSCRGFSYDSGTEVFTEHTCRATNTCGGFSCVVCD
jgi:hypothetical protein